MSFKPPLVICRPPGAPFRTGRRKPVTESERASPATTHSAALVQAMPSGFQPEAVLVRVAPTVPLVTFATMMWEEGVTLLPASPATSHRARRTGDGFEGAEA